MHGDALLLIFAMVFGCAAFLFGIIYLICRMLGWVGRGFAGIFRPGTAVAKRGEASGGQSGRICQREECRNVESRLDARYCSRCGAPLDGAGCEPS